MSLNSSQTLEMDGDVDPCLAVSHDSKDTAFQVDAYSKNVISTPLLSFEVLRQQVDEELAVMLYDAVTAALDFLKQQVALHAKEQKNIFSSKEPPAFFLPFESLKHLNYNLDSSSLDAWSTPCISFILYKCLQNPDVFPPIFDQLMKDLGAYGICRVPWCILRMILLLKAEQVLLGVLPDKAYSLKTILDGLRPLRVSMGHFWKLNLAPFTVQRTAEFLLSYNAVPSQRAALKYMYSLTKIINFASIWLTHRIPDCLTDLEHLLEANSECSALLNIINPGLMATSLLIAEFYTTVQNDVSDSILGDNRHINDNNNDDEDVTTPHPSSRLSQHSDPRRAGRRRSRNSFEVYTPRRGCSSERFNADVEAEELSENSLVCRSANGRTAPHSTTTMSGVNSEYSGLNKDQILSVAPEVSLLDMGMNGSGLLTSSDSVAQGSNDLSENCLFPIQSTWKTKIASENDHSDEKLFRPPKRVKVQFLSEVSYIKSNYSDVLTQPKESHPFEHGQSSLSLYLDEKNEEGENSITEVSQLDAFDIVPPNAKDFTSDQHDIINSHNENTTLDQESLSFLEHLRSSSLPSETYNLLPKDYFEDLDEPDKSSQRTFKEAEERNMNGNPNFNECHQLGVDSKVSDTCSEATRLLSECLRGVSHS